MTAPQIRLVEEPAEQAALTPLMDRCAEAAMSEYRDEPLPPEVGARFLARAGDAPQTVLLVAEGDALPSGEPAGLLVVGPLTDPLTGEVIPIICLLHVRPDQRHVGLARRLVDAARGVLQERGQPTLAARAGHNDDALISMGERWGFVRQWELMLLE